MNNYAQAIAMRISDEWAGGDDFPEDAVVLRQVLAELFTKHPDACQKLIGTGIIEENYFDDL